VTRAHLDDDARLALVKLCIEHQGEHYHGNKTAFWNKISVLLAQEHGVRLKDPKSTISSLTGPRRAVVAKQKKESGTSQKDDELSQALDLWIEFEDEQERQKEDTKKSAEAKEKEQAEAATRRADLFKSRSGKTKKRAQAAQDPDDNGGGPGEESDADSDREGKRPEKRRKGPGASADTLALVDALNDFSEGIQNAIVESAEIQAASGNGAIEELKAKIDKQREEDLRARQEEEKSRTEVRGMLAAVLAKLGS
jgi:hypothetical protein